MTPNVEALVMIAQTIARLRHGDSPTKGALMGSVLVCAPLVAASPSERVAAYEELWRRYGHV